MASHLGYYRFPAIHADQIYFCSDDDLWCVLDRGGVARRLTVSRSAVTHPIVSPDGEWIAFAGADEGATEVYRIPAAGGEARRLTFFGVMTYPVAWSPDGGQIIFASDSGRPFMKDHQLFAIAADGGPARALGLGPARAYAFEPDGPGRALARNGGDPARWKRYRGGTVGTLWVDRRGEGEFSQLLKSLDGNIASPMWIGKRIYFVSDHEGVANLYSVRPDGRGAVVRHTHHEEFYVRFPATDGERIVYHAGADLFLYDPERDAETPLPVEIRSSRPQRQRKFVSGGTLEDYDPHPAGHSLALTVRGRPVAMGLWEGPATEFGLPWRGRHRLARWLNDGKRLIAVTDEGGEEELEVITPGAGVERIKLDADLGRVIDLVVAPPPLEDETAGRRGKRRTKKKAPRRARRAPDLVALTNQRQELWLIDVTAKRARRIDRSDADRIAGLAWSPDRRWIAYGLPLDRRHVAIRIAAADSGKIEQVTTGDFIDLHPSFDPEGRYLYFLSLRTYDPLYDLLQFGLGFPRGVRPYLITLRADATSPFMPAPRPLGAGAAGQINGQNPWEISDDAQASPPKGAADKPGEAQRKPVEIDFDGITERVLAFPVPEGRYSDLLAAPGKVFYLSYPIEGSLGQSWVPGVPPAKASIEVFDLREQKGATYASGVSNLKIGADGKTLLYQAGSRLRALLAAAEPGKAPAGTEPGRATGWIDLGRVRCAVDPAAEWRQMVAEAWRLQRDQFWVPDMSRLDWKRIYQRYAPLVERVSTRAELSDLIWEMQGELGTSHAYEIGGDYRATPAYRVGFLGADLTYNRREGVWQVARIPTGDPWDLQQGSPLAAPGMRMTAGTRIHAVNGRELDRDLSPLECLVCRAGQEVWLTVSDPPPRGKQRARRARPRRRTVTVRTLGSEYLLRYRDWVESNRAWVHRRSRGAIGYIHIPNMGPQGYAEFHRYFLSELDRKGLIVDVRHNGGGHVSQLLLTKLLRRRIGYDISRYGQPEPYMSEAPRGPMVALTDELAGSDGDIFSHAWKLYGLGPLIGKRTWGGVIGIYPRHLLVDGSVTTQPEFSFWFEDVGWNVENYGTDPDIEVDFRPQDYARGSDPQLERGLKEVLRIEQRFREKLPDMRRRPSRALPKLPSAPAEAAGPKPSRRPARTPRRHR